MIPDVVPSRFQTVEQINKRIAEDDLGKFKQVRVLVRMKQLHEKTTGFALVESLAEE